MRSLILSLILCVSCAAMAQEQQPGSGGGNSQGKGQRTRKVRPNPKAIEAITATIASMQKAWDKGDVAGYSAGMADDVSFITVAGDAIQGKSQLDKRHTELFHKFFKGSHQVATLRQSQFVRPRVVICDVEVEISGYQSLPPGLSAKAGQPLRMWTRYVMTLDGQKWLIRSGQSTEIRDKGKK